MFDFVSFCLALPGFVLVCFGVYWLGGGGCLFGVFLVCLVFLFVCFCFVLFVCFVLFCFVLLLFLVYIFFGGGCFVLFCLLGFFFFFGRGGGGLAWLLNVQASEWLPRGRICSDNYTCSQVAFKNCHLTHIKQTPGQSVQALAPRVFRAVLITCYLIMSYSDTTQNASQERI